MNLTLSIDEQLVERAREKLRATGKSINQEIREHLEHIVGDDEPARACGYPRIYNQLRGFESCVLKRKF